MAIPLYAAALMAVCVMLTTTQAAPIMFSLQRILDNPVALQQAVEGFYRCDSIRAVLGALEGCAEIWVLSALLSLQVGNKAPAHENLDSF